MVIDAIKISVTSAISITADRKRNNSTLNNITPTVIEVIAIYEVLAASKLCLIMLIPLNLGVP